MATNGTDGKLHPDDVGKPLSETATGTKGRSNPVIEELRRALAGQTLASIGEAQAVVDRIAYRHNHTPSNDFVGLSPEQMYWMLHHPFDAPHLATFPAVLASPLQAPIATLFEMLIGAIGESSARPTARGYFPRNAVLAASIAYRGEEGHQSALRYGAIRSETDFPEFHVTRLMAQLAGFVRKYKGQFVTTRACRTLLDKHGLAGVYPGLLRAYAQRFNWGFRDGYPELEIVQESFLFTLYLVHRFGDTWRESAFYEDAFLRAFPRALDMIESSPFATPEKSLRRCYHRRCLQNFLVFFGLIEVDPVPREPFGEWSRLRKIPLLDNVVTFHV
jgi:hypothetical protein